MVRRQRTLTMTEDLTVPAAIPREGMIRVTVAGQDKDYQYHELGVTFESTDNEILEAVNRDVSEALGVNLLAGFTSGDYIIKRSTNSHNIAIFPASPAGVDKL